MSRALDGHSDDDVATARVAIRAGNVPLKAA